MYLIKKRLVSMNRFVILFAVLSVFLIGGCDSGVVELPETTTNYSMNNPTIQEIFDLQDRRRAQDLLVFFDHQDATYRYLTAMALASIQDTTDEIIGRLAEAATDIDENVRYAALLALGETYSEKAVKPLLAAFKNDLATADNRLNAMILESIGKCAPAKHLSYLVKPSNFGAKDTILLEGQARGIYEFMLRGIDYDKGTQKMIDLASDKKMPTNVRRVAANYLARVKNVDLTPFKTEILGTIRDANDIFFQLPMILSIAKINDADSSALKTLQTQFNRATDYRVKINILRVASDMEYFSTKALFKKALKDKNQHVRLAAGNHFREKGIRKDVDEYFAVGSDSTAKDWRLRITMLATSLKHVSYTRFALRKQINEQLISFYQKSEDPYKKGMAIKGLSEFAVNYKMMIDESQKTDLHPYVRTSALEGLINIRANPKLRAVYGEYYSGVAYNIQNAFKTAIASGDIGMIAVANEALRNPKFKYNTYFRYNHDFLKAAQVKLDSVKQADAFYDLQKTIDLFQRKEAKERPRAAYNHPINWETVKKIAGNTIATIETNKGNIVISFYPTLSPGAVGNFVDLINKKYYEGKVFHRVVPNFVVQNGCNRGDGHGSANYTIRTTTNPLTYNDEGYIGMARSEKDTENTQFFITHRPAMHLDHRYTILGKVVEGMDIVHDIMVGDNIKKITIKQLAEAN